MGTDERAIIVCGPVARIAGSRRTTCSRCAAPVFISPSGLLKKGERVCVACARAIIAADPNPVILPPTADQLAELAVWAQRYESVWQGDR